MDLQNADWILTVRFYYENEKGYASEATYSFPAYYTIGVAVAKRIDLSKNIKNKFMNKQKMKILE